MARVDAGPEGWEDHDFLVGMRFQGDFHSAFHVGLVENPVQIDFEGTWESKHNI